MTVLSFTWESPYLGKTVFILSPDPLGFWSFNTIDSYNFSRSKTTFVLYIDFKPRNLTLPAQVNQIGTCDACLKRTYDTHFHINIMLTVTLLIYYLFDFSKKIWIQLNHQEFFQCIQYKSKVLYQMFPILSKYQNIYFLIKTTLFINTKHIIIGLIENWNQWQ